MIGKQVLSTNVYFILFGIRINYNGLQSLNYTVVSSFITVKVKLIVNGTVHDLLLCQYLF